MKKIIFTLAVLATIAVQADYLYWMVTPNAQSGKDISGGDTTFDWTDAKLLAGDTVVGTLSFDDADFLYNTLGTYAISGDIADYSASTFFVELYNEDQWLAKSAGASGSSLAQYITGSMSMTPPAGGWVAGSYAVPEPTSGLLFLVGGMLLGLKRRRQKV